MVIRQILIITVCVMIGSSAAGCNRNRPLAEPSFILAIYNQAKIHQAIRQALLSRRWIILAQTSNSFDAEYQRGRDISATVRVIHQGNQVTVKYLSSSNLDYTDYQGSPQIHRRYNDWMANLERDIQTEVGRAL